MAVKGYERITLSDRTRRALSVIGIGGNQKGKAKIFRQSSASKYLQQMPIIDGKYVFRGDILHSANINGKTAPGVYKVDSIFTDKNGKATAKLLDMSNSDKKTNKVFLRGDSFEDISKRLKSFNVSDSKYADIKEIKKLTRDKLYDRYSNTATRDLEGLEKCSGMIESRQCNAKLCNCSS
jgi:hypothetical protein